MSEAEERAAFEAAVNGLVPETKEMAIVPETGDEQDELPPEGEPRNHLGDESNEETAAEGEAKGSAAEKFQLGGMLEEEIVEKLRRLDQLEDVLYRQVTSKVMGKFGEVNQQLQALQEREIRFDPEKLRRLREVDEDLAKALAEDLSEALKGQQFDRDAVLNDLRGAVVQDVNPYVEQRLLAALVPDAVEIAKSEDFAKWFFEVAPQAVRDTFEAWDAGTMMDGVAMAQAFRKFEEWKRGQEAAKAEKEKVAESAVEESKSGQKTQARAPMTEEEAFLKRLEEMKQ